MALTTAAPPPIIRALGWTRFRRGGLGRAWIAPPVILAIRRRAVPPVILAIGSRAFPPVVTTRLGGRGRGLGLGGRVSAAAPPPVGKSALRSSKVSELF